MSFAADLNDAYFMRRLGETRRLQSLAASIQFDLARLPVDDDQLEEIVAAFGAEQGQTGWGFSEALHELLSREPRRVPVKDLAQLQENLKAQGYLPPDHPASGAWDAVSYGAFRRADRDAKDASRSGHSMTATSLETGIRWIGYTLPRSVWQGIVGSAKGLVEQAGETAGRVGLLGGAAAGAAIGGAAFGGVGALPGAAAGAAIGFFADLFRTDEGEEDQALWVRFADALQPFDEYAGNSKAFFEDLGFVATAASLGWGAKYAVQGAKAGMEAIQAVRTGTPALGVTEGPWAAAAGAQPSLTSAALMRPPGVQPQLGVFGSITRGLLHKARPGTVTALEEAMVRYSPMANMQRLGPQMISKVYTGMSAGQMGARLSAGLGWGERDTTIEEALAAEPLPWEESLVASFTELAAAFVLWPQKIFPGSFRGIGRAAQKLQGETALAPVAELIRAEEGIGIAAAVRKAREINQGELTFLYSEYGLYREAHEMIRLAGHTPEKAFVSRSLEHARAFIIRLIRKEGKDSPTLRRLIEYGIKDPDRFRAWMQELTAEGRGLSKLKGWIEANRIARQLERDVADIAKRSHIDTPIAVGAGRRLVRTDVILEGAQGTKHRINLMGVKRAPSSEAFDVATIEAQALKLSNAAKKMKSEAYRLSPQMAEKRIVQANLLEQQARTLADTAKAAPSKPGKAVLRTIGEDFRLIPARSDYVTRSEYFAARRTYLEKLDDLQRSSEVGLGSPAHSEAYQRFVNYVDEMKRDGLVPADAANRVKVSVPPKRAAKKLADILEKRGRSAARDVDVPPEISEKMRALGYKLIESGPDVLFPEDVTALTELIGIGDYTRRAQIWDTIALSPVFHPDRSLSKLRHGHELTEIEQVLRERGIVMSPQEALAKLHDEMATIEDVATGRTAVVMREGKPHLRKVDLRDLSVDDVMHAFRDELGFTPTVAEEIYGALKRGAAFGGEAKLHDFGLSLRGLGAATRVQGLAGFSDYIRTAHLKDPLGRVRAARRFARWGNKPTAELARSPERARFAAQFREVGRGAHLSNHEQEFNMFLVDRLAEAGVASGRFANVDDVFKQWDVRFAEEFSREKTVDTLLQRVKEAPSFEDLKALSVTFEDNKFWYENSARALADAIPPGKVELYSGEVIDLYDFSARVIAATSPMRDPFDNLDLALEVIRGFLRGEEVFPAGLLPNSQMILEDIFAGRSWQSIGKRFKVSPFYENLMGNADVVTVDTWMARLFGYGDIQGVKHTLTKLQSQGIANEVIRVADDLGWKPMQVQAALWKAVKADAAEWYMREARALQEAGDLRRASSMRTSARNVADARSFEDAVKLPRFAERFDDLNAYALLQRVEDDVRGMIEFGPDFAATMTFFRTADWRTLVHENAHLLRRILPPEHLAQIEKDLDVIRGPIVTYLPVSGERFSTARAMVAQERQHFLTPFTAEQIEKGGMRAFLSDDGKVGFILKPDGEIANLFNVSGQRGAGALAMNEAIRLGGRRVEYFDTPKLRKLYERLGFKETERFPFDLDIIRKDFPDYDPAKLGRPDYVVAELEATPLAAFRDRKKFSKMAEAIRKQTVDLESPGGGGATWNPHTGEMIEAGKPGAGTAVAVSEAHAPVLDGARVASDPAYFKRELANFVRVNEDVFQNPRMFVGTWWDRETGQIALDVSEVLQNQKLARQLGSLRHEKAVFDLEKLEDLDVLPVGWTRAKEELFASHAEEWVRSKMTFREGKPVSAGAWEGLRFAVGNLWQKIRGYGYAENVITASERKIFDEFFKDIIAIAPPTKSQRAAAALRSKQAVGGAAIGAAAGAAEGDERFKDALRGAIMGGFGGLAARGALARTYGYLPDFLVRLNTALRYSLSFTFDAGRYTEASSIMAMKHGLPGALRPRKKLLARTWPKSPYSNGPVTGEQALKDAFRLLDDLGDTRMMRVIEDIDRRGAQIGLLGFNPRESEAYYAWLMYQRGWSKAKMLEAIPDVNRYGLGRTAFEKSANFVFFPFSFSKKYLTTLGDFMLAAPGRNFLIHEGLRRYKESEFNDKVNEVLERNLPLLQQLWMVNNLAFGISPGRFFLEGLSDHRTKVGETMQILASVFIPSGAATPLAQAAGGLGDFAINAFVPVVLTGESFDAAGGIDGIEDIIRRYVPMIREIDSYYRSAKEQLVAATEGATPWGQFQSYNDELRLAKADLLPLALSFGYTSVDGLLQSELGIPFAANLEATKNELQGKYPTGFKMTADFTNQAVLDTRALVELVQRPNRSEGEDAILDIAENIEKLRYIGETSRLPREALSAMLLYTVRQMALRFEGDRRFRELYDRFFLRDYGPISRTDPNVRAA